MTRTVHVNGDYVPEDQAKVSVFDRGFLMADGVYEVTSVLDGKLIDFPGHCTRLARSLSELDITNVRIHCGRAEEMMDGHRGTYDVVLGRSVTALPTFCSWIYELMKKQKQKDRSGGEGRNDHAIGDTSGGGRLIYIIGGDIDDMVQSKVVGDIPIDALLQRSEHISDKRALVFSALGVRQIATEFLGAKRMDEETRKGQRSNVARNNSNNYKSTNNGRVGGRGGGGAGERRAGVGGERRGGAGAGVRRDKQARGAWSEKRNDGVAKQRGYDDFKRYESSP